jgi:hypothetical protein
MPSRILFSILCSNVYNENDILVNIFSANYEYNQRDATI